MDFINRFPIPPFHRFLYLSLIGIAMFWLFVWVSSQVPHMDGELTHDGEQIFYNGEAIKSITNGTTQLEITKVDLLKETDLLPNWEQYNQSLLRQQQLLDFIEGNEVAFVTVTGEEIGVSFRESHANDLRFGIWLAFVCGFIGWTIAAGIYSFSPVSNVTRALLFSGFCYMTGLMTFASYAYRDFVMDPEWLRFLNIVNHIGISGWAWGMVYLLWSYPRIMGHRHLLVTFTVFELILLVNHLFKLFDLPIHTFYFRHLVEITLAVSVCVMQWRASKDDLIHRAALSWFLMSILFSAIFSALFYVLPFIFTPGIEIRYEVVVVSSLTVFLGFAFGVGRFKLFELDRWWYEIWLWFFAGITVIAIDAAFVYLMHLEPLGALTVSILFAGWIYFPLRQFLWRRFKISEGPGITALLPELISQQLHSVSEKDRNATWVSFIKSRFSPLFTESHFGTIEGCQLRQEGVEMLVPSMEPDNHIRVMHCNRGNRLFNQEDVKLIDRLFEVASELAGVQRKQEKIESNERERIMRDLHDDLGTVLLGMIHVDDRVEIKNKAKGALSVLREVIFCLQEQGQIESDEFFIEVRQEIAELAEHAGLTLNWDYSCDHPVISRTLASNVRRIIKESVNNSVKHSGCDTIDCMVEIKQSKITLNIKDNGKGFDVYAPRNGQGLQNFYKRAALIQGRIEVDSNENKGTRIHLEATLNPQLI